MKATQFFLFMGPKLWSFRRGEVEYGIKAIPAGGYVRIIGMSNVEVGELSVQVRLPELLFGDPSYHRELLAQRIGI